MLKSFSEWHIDVEIKEKDVADMWRFTGFYGSLMENQRHESWNILRQLKGNNTLAWLVLDDFNEILYSFEKKKGKNTI